MKGKREAREGRMREVEMRVRGERYGRKKENKMIKIILNNNI
jgi:hypothetical protein